MLEVTFKDWQSKHKVEGVLLLITILLASTTSLLTAYANLTGSGLQVFEDNPMLPWAMAALAPLSGIAVKTIHEYLRTDLAIKTFTFVLITTMLLSIGFWVVLYADMYHGLSPQVSISCVFDEPSIWDRFRDTAFVVVSLTTEVLIGSALGLRLSIIAGQYSPDYSYPNPEYIRLLRQETTLTEPPPT